MSARHVWRRLRRRLLGDRWFFWKVGVKSKLLRLRCVLLGGHVHEWKELRGGGAGYDALICQRCYCHIAEYRQASTSPASAREMGEGSP
jgi:hypothetical protein